VAQYDYIVVGSGAAGCVLASRLSEDPAARVLVLEHGPPDWNPMHRVPKGFFFTSLRGGRYTYHYRALLAGLDGRTEVWTRGKVLGGSTTINGMMYTRGFAADFDGLVAAGNPGWGWNEILPIYRAMEDHQLGASDTRGTGGPYRVSVPQGDELASPIITAAERFGLQYVRDTNDRELARIGYTPSSIDRGRRVSSASAFLRPALQRPNITCRTGARVIRAIAQGDRIVGVEVRQRGSIVEYRAAKEVILCAGCIESPLLLERSGIGNRAILEPAGIPVLAESPNVGERMLEQRGSTMQVRLRTSLGSTEKLNSLTKQGWEGAKYLFTRSGPIARAGYDLVAQWKSSPDAERPDIQGLFIPMALDATQFNTVKLADHSGIMFLGFQLRPTTQGSVHIDPRDAMTPVITARYLESEIDREVTGAVLRDARAILSASPVGDLVAEEEYPGDAVVTTDEAIDYARRSGAVTYHSVGSAAMGPADGDVVDCRLRVRGVDGLRVVDASVFPVHVAGNTAAPTMALAWRAADMIREDG
jgi:choline dehydrogenase